ncbi:MAG: putative glycoside hydrolase [Thermodesulfobacteriota bacterium]|nr:putative glycoside hydrolase [Thermodesulfobacteriota bacterium]
MLIKKRHEVCIGLIVFLLLLIPVYAMAYTAGKVVDLFTKKPVTGAFITVNQYGVLTGQNGSFTVNTELNKFAVRAPGYRRVEQIIRTPLNSISHEIKLIPFTPKGLYLSFYGIGDRGLRGSAINLIQETELNTLVIDVKGDKGMIPYKSSIPLAAEVGAQRITTVREMADLMRSLKEKGIYTIARIVVFKDNPLALARPDWAVKTQNGEIWRDRENLFWVDPFNREVWDYNINIAIEAAKHGFDEIQFDYVRFPDALGLRFSMPNTEENRVKAITGFLMEARRRLIPHNVFLSADIFGYVCWNRNDTDIGQRLEDLAPHLDYICPMLYPSGFQYGIPGYRNPVANAYEIIYLSLKRAQERTGLPSYRFRPWLQAFRDYAFDRRYFNEKEIMGEVKAAEGFGSHGWMLWNPRNNYSSIPR